MVRGLLLDIPDERGDVLFAEGECAIGPLPFEGLSGEQHMGDQMRCGPFHRLGEPGDIYGGMKPYQDMNVVCHTSDGQRLTVQMAAPLSYRGMNASYDVGGKPRQAVPGRPYQMNVEFGKCYERS
jgi:hypothetical protein